MDEISIGEKTYISSKRAAEITGYAKDYVGQLCREGHVEAKMVGRSWYVFEPSIREHRFGKAEQSADSTPTEPEQALPVEQEEGGLLGEEVVPVSQAGVANDMKETAAKAPWTPSTYLPDHHEPIPSLQSVTRRSINVLEEPAGGAGAASLTDMQMAWREWFEQRQQGRQAPTQAIERAEPPTQEPVWEERLEEVDGGHQESYDLRDEEESAEEVESGVYEDASDPIVEEQAVEEVVESIPIHRLHTREPAPIYASRAQQEPEARIIHEKIVQYRKPSAVPAATRQVRTNWVAAFMLLTIGIIVLTIGVLGSGIADDFLLSRGLVNPIPGFLVGESTVK